jgi:hypothetical protein
MNQDALANIQERRAEAAAKLKRLEDRPDELRLEIRDADGEGEVGRADRLEAELAELIGPLEAARYRAGVLNKLASDAELHARVMGDPNAPVAVDPYAGPRTPQAAAALAANQEEWDREKWGSRQVDHPSHMSPDLLRPGIF